MRPLSGFDAARDARVAVILRTRDRPLLLSRALDGIAAQTETRWQLCLVNDGGPTAPIADLIRARAGLAGRLRVLHHPAPRGMEAASNAGLCATSAPFAVIHDDDDTWQPAFLSSCLAVLEAQAHLPALGAVATQSTRVYEDIEGD